MTNSCTRNNCINGTGCPSDRSGICPDFRIKRFDTRPVFETLIKDCNTPVDLNSTVVEVSMWAKARFKSAVTSTDTYFALADNIGFTQVLIGDIIIVAGNPRTPEQMLVVGFDEENYLIEVSRGYNGTPVVGYKRGTPIRIMRVLNGIGTTEMTLTDVDQVDGTVNENVLTQSKLIYEWVAQDTCLSGCYYLELKLLKMIVVDSFNGTQQMITSEITPTFTSLSATEIGCQLGEGVEWVRRFPADREGYLIEIVDSPTSEQVV